MTKKEFRQLADQQIIMMDGATGSNLVKRGMPAGVCPEEWILDHKEIFIGLQMEYLEAGSNILLTPTFTGNRIKLAEYQLTDRIEEINRELAGLTREAIRRFKTMHPDAKCFAAADITMTGKQLRPMGDFEFEELIDVYKEQLQFLIAAGVDLIIVETMMSLQETRAAVIAAKEICELPILASLSFENDGRTLYGTDATTAMAVLQSLGADAVGANCSTGPDIMLENIRKMAAIATVPIIAKPNAGLPKLDGVGNTYYDMEPAEFSKLMVPIIEAGATLVGGCCGTTPEHIRMLSQIAKELQANRVYHKEPIRYLASEKMTVTFGIDNPFLVIGERINPTGKKKLQAKLREGSLDLVENFAIEQEEMQADFLDINMGMSGIDEKEMMLKAIETVTANVKLPLVLDSSHVDVIEAALRNYPGRALINSISLEKVKMEGMLPLARKYGAMFILLPLSDEGLPKDLTEKKEIIQKILQKARKLGISNQDIIVDGLVATIGANKNAALETLETIRYCKEELKLPTVVGLSNISFGLPERSNVNASFLSLAIKEGLTMAIANPSQRQLIASAFATDMLLNKENADIRYINYINDLKEQYPEMAPMGTICVNQMETKTADKTSNSVQKTSSSQISNRDEIFQAVMRGNRTSIVELSKRAVEEGRNASDILNESLLPAINEVGNLFESGKYFLPQLIAGAEAMKNAIEYLEPYMKKEGDATKKGTIVIATVKGDIHDIGKNLVALMLKNYGYKVIDLGKDVSKEEIVEKAIEFHADIIALSALMTTTMKEMKNVVELAKEKGIPCRIMIGGAVITQDYADEIGADGYSKDAQDAVKLAAKLMENQ